MRLDKKVAIVTGAAKGLGAAMAQLFASEGAKVVAADMMELTYSQDNVEFYQLNVTDGDACQSASILSFLVEVISTTAVRGRDLLAFFC